MLEHIKHNAASMNHSPSLSAVSALTLLLFVFSLVLIFIMPDYLYFSGKDLRNYIFSLNYRVVPALVFIFVLFPLVAFGKFSFLSFGVSYYHFKDEIKNSSFFETLLKKVLLSFSYCLALLLMIYFVPPLIRRMFGGTISVGFSDLFPFPFVSFILFPLLYFSVNFFVWSLIFTNLDNLYWQYYLIPFLLVANVFAIGFFKKNTIKIISETTIVVTFALTLASVVLLGFGERKYRKTQ